MSIQKDSNNKKQFHQNCHCPVCFSSENVSFLSMNGIPVLGSAVYSSYDEAVQAPRGDMLLVVCQGCGQIYNTAFDPDLVEYGQHYENTLFSSQLFIQYAETLAEELIKRYHLVQKDIIAVGCGRGEFLELLCKKGGNRGVGFDPSLILYTIVNKMPEQITYIRDYYTPSYAHYPVDLLVCSHVLEHVYNLRDFLNNIRQIIGDRRPVIYTEVPNVIYCFREQAMWDFTYEHYSYFSHNSLVDLFSRCKFIVCSLKERFGSQSLSIEALPAKDPIEYGHDDFVSVEEISTSALLFADIFRKKVEEWRDKIRKINQLGQKIVIWGTGSRGVTFLNWVDNDRVVEYAIDINSYKHGNYVAGTGQKIMPPDFLCDYQPNKVIVMNPIYFDEIREKIYSLKVKVELIPS